MYCIPTPGVPRPAGAKLPAAEIKRLKGLGCLQDKRFDDVFNIRVITRNGKITVDEQRAVAEAAERFGSGEVTMTTRLTLEIQGVSYDNIDACIGFLQDHGLDAGGTGSKVRPVVSCKGTTCQYGLIDTLPWAAAPTCASSPTSTTWASLASACRRSTSRSAARARSARS